MLQPILIVLHQENSTPGRVGHALRERGYPLDMRRPRFGDPLPDTMAEHAGAIIFGGPMSANDTDDFIRREIDWIAVPLREKKPFLGICLGAQMLAHHLGSRVYKHPEGHAEVGYYPIRPTDTGRAVCDPWPEQVYQWHREGFDLPLGAELLAEGDSFPGAGVPLRRAAYALQFHPDVTHAMMCRWTTRGHERMPMPNAKPRAAHFADRAVYDPAGRAWLAAFLNHWLGQADAERRPVRSNARASLRLLPRVEGVRPGRAPGRRASRSATTSRMPTPPTSTAGMAPSQAAIDAGAEIAELIGGADEQRVHRVDAAAHGVGRLDLHQRHADHHADRVRRRRAPPARPSTTERLRQREHDGGDAEAGDAREHDAADALA